MREQTYTIDTLLDSLYTDHITPCLMSCDPAARRQEWRCPSIRIPGKIFCLSASTFRACPQNKQEGAYIQLASAHTRPRLYCDIDGVLFGDYGGSYELRPGVVSFLRWCVFRFDCFWLTGWPQERIAQLMELLYAPDLLNHFRYQEWDREKLGAITAGTPAVWIDDQIDDDLEVEVAMRGVTAIAVEPLGRNQLVVVKLQLRRYLIDHGYADGEEVP
jgi:hypothetical protein